MNTVSVTEQVTYRQDAVSKVIGEYVYGMDFAMVGCLHGYVLRSPHPHARIVSMNVSSAEAMPGVHAIITGKDVGEVMMPNMVGDQPPLAVDCVRYVGEPVALVAAATLASAAEAARHIEIKYEILPAITDAEESMRPDAPLIHQNWSDYAAPDDLVRERNVSGQATVVCGDVVEGFKKADFVFEDSFMTESVHQLAVEPRVALGIVESSNKVTVHTNTQLPFWARSTVAVVLGITESNVRIIPTGMGGGFGAKLYPVLEPLVALLARKACRPVRIVMSPEDELLAGLPRHPVKIHLKTGVNADGTLIARQARLILDTGAYAGSGPQIASVSALMAHGPYRTPNMQIDAYAVLTNKMSFGAYRSPGGPQAVFALESHFDDVSEKIGMDPLDFRLKNIVDDGDELGNGQVMHDVGLREALEKAAEAIDWEKPAGPNRGKGLACSWWTTTLGASNCSLKMDADGRIVVTVGAPEIGTGAVMGGIPKIVSELMGVSVQDIVVEVGDTVNGPYDFGSQGSRTLFNVGRAAQFASDDLTRQIKELAGDMLDISVEELGAEGVELDQLLELQDGDVVVKGSPGRRVSLAEVGKRAFETQGGLYSRSLSIPDPTGFDENKAISCLYPAFHYPSFFCHGVEVEVDPDTGKVEVVKYAAAHDVGFAVTPPLAAGQIHGGVVQGIGMALMEEIMYQDGHVLNNNWTDYKAPTIADVPEVQAILVERPVEDGTFGNKGLAEAPVATPPAAIANAVYNATGVRLHSLPITAEKVQRARQKIKEGV